MKIDRLQSDIRKAMKHFPAHTNVARIRLFGSRLHGDYRENSDLDLIVEFHQPVGYLALVGLQQHLEKQLRLPVDLVTPRALSRFYRNDVLHEAEIVYEG